MKYQLNSSIFCREQVLQKHVEVFDITLFGHLATLPAFPRFLLKFREEEGGGGKKRDCGGGHELAQ